MFEKEAEEIAKGIYIHHFNNDIIYPNVLKGITVGVQKGAEFGYKEGIKTLDDMTRAFNREHRKYTELRIANEWHYPSKGEYPKDDKQYLVLFFYNYKGKEEMSCSIRDSLHSDFKIHRCYTEQIYAWKEIVLPKESE